MPYYGTKRKVFISFYQGNRQEVDDFIDHWASREGIFIPKALGASYDQDDFINSDNPEYVMSQIRDKYLGDSSVTLVLIGKCTHSRRYVDWELKSTLRRGNYTPNGLIGILLPSAGDSANLPPRFKANWNKDHTSCYARYYYPPSSTEQLASWIEDAFAARTARANLIQNDSDMMKYNSKCLVCGLTH
jgi:hypothetical protein